MRCVGIFKNADIQVRTAVTGPRCRTASLFHPSSTESRRNLGLTILRTHACHSRLPIFTVFRPCTILNILSSFVILSLLCSYKARKLSPPDCLVQLVNKLANTLRAHTPDTLLGSLQVALDTAAHHRLHCFFTTETHQIESSSGKRWQ